MEEDAQLNSLNLQEDLLCSSLPGQTVLPVSRYLGITIMSARETLKIHNNLKCKYSMEKKIKNIFSVIPFLITCCRAA